MPAADVAVVQYRVQGLFPVELPFLQHGWTTIYADGSVLAPFSGEMYAQPQVWPYETGHVDPSRVAELLASAAAAGLLGPPTPASPPSPTNIGDPARTTVIITTADGSFIHSVDGLVTAGPETDPDRAAVQAFVGAVASLSMDAMRADQDSSGATRFYEPVALDIVTAEVTAASPGPGTNTVIAWTPTGAGLASMSTCTVVSDADAIAFLQSNLAGRTYEQDGRQFRIASRIHPPGTSCET